MSAKLNDRVGALGEDVASAFLKKLGWRLVGRNYRVNRAEIDLIAVDGDEVVFVEVKTLRGRDFGTPEERVDRQKQRQLSRAALHYVREHRLAGAKCRFDVIAVLCAETEPQVRHFRDAFEMHPSFDV